MIEITLESNALDRAIQFIDGAGKAAAPILARVLNRVAEGMKTDGPRVLREKYSALKTKDIKSTLTTVKASPSVLASGLISQGSRLPLIKFATPTASGVRVKINSTAILERAFIATMKSGHKGVFEREADTRLPINEKFTASVAEFLANKAVSDRIEAGANERFEKRFDHEVDRALRV